MSQFIKLVSASADDGYWAGSWSYNGSTVGIGKNFLGGTVYGAFRFNNVTVPQGTTITSAYLRITSDETKSDNILFTLKGIDEDDTADFTSDPDSRAKTTAGVNWQINGQTAGTEYTSPDIKTIIQEIIDRGGWASGNDLGIITQDNGTANDKIGRFKAYDTSTTLCAELEINYSGASPSASQSPSASASLSPSASQSPSSSQSPSASISPSPSPPPEEYFGLKVSKPGIDVLSATSPNDFYLHSMFPLLKVHSFGTFTFAISTGTTTINHNLGYKPFVLVFSKLVSYDYVGLANILTDEYYQHDWAIQGASKEWWGRTEIFDNKIDIHVGQTDAFSPVSQVTGFYYIFKDET